MYSIDLLVNGEWEKMTDAMGYCNSYEVMVNLAKNHCAIARMRGDCSNIVWETVDFSKESLKALDWTKNGF